MPHIKELTIDGLRGVSEPLSLRLAVPDGRHGSGLTVLVGSNNSGKSTIVEAFDAMSKSQDNLPSFSIGKRNARNPDHLVIRCVFVGDEEKENRLEAIHGGSETTWSKRDVVNPDIVVVPSRRGFEAYFSQSPRLIETGTTATAERPVRGHKHWNLSKDNYLRSTLKVAEVSSTKC